MSLILDTFEKKQEEIPIWLMRQAGRYLKEYMSVRINIERFLDLCYDPIKATEVTMQPIDKFGFDAAILFADILVIPDALGVKVEFAKDHGPILEKIKGEEDIDNLYFSETKLENIYKSVANIRKELPQSKTLIGFSGSPWSLAAYMIEGGSSREYLHAKKMAYNNPSLFAKLIDKLVNAISIYLIKQIENGAEIVQIFDSWAGVLDEYNFSAWVIEPTRKIVEQVKSKCPKVKIIGFPGAAGTNLKNYVEKTKIDAVSLHSTLSLEYALDNIKEDVVLQGNLDPVYLLGEDKEFIAGQVKKILELTEKRKFIFNLGHGVIKETDPKMVTYLMDLVKGRR